MKKFSTNERPNWDLLDHFTETDVIAANKKVYNENSKSYDQIVITKNSNKRLRKILENVLIVLQKKKWFIHEWFIGK